MGICVVFVCDGCGAKTEPEPMSKHYSGESGWSWGIGRYEEGEDEGERIGIVDSCYCPACGDREYSDLIGLA